MRWMFLALMFICSTALAAPMTIGDLYVVNNVGISSTAPADKLNVTGSIRLTQTLKMLDGQAINWSNGSATISTTGSTAYAMLFNTYDGATNSEKMRIMGSGNVGIGTTAPLAHLQVGHGNPSMSLTTALGSTDALIKGRLEVDSHLYVNGNIGIGTTDTSTPLVIARLGAASNAIYFTSPNAIIRWGGGSYFSNTGVYSGGADQESKTYDGANVQTRLFIKASNGNVGIGTTAPLAHLQVGHGNPSMSLTTALGSTDALIKGRLEVDSTVYLNGWVGVGTTTPTSNIHIYSSLSDFKIQSTNVDSYARMWFKNDSANGWNIGQRGDLGMADGFSIEGNDGVAGWLSKLFIQQAGNVGIGTTAPLAHLQVGHGNSAMTLTTPLGQNDALIKGRLEVDSTVYVNGNVGIGTTRPVSILHVAGNADVAWVANGASYALNTIGTPGAQGSLWINAPTANAFFNGGLAITNIYNSSPQMVVSKIISYGVKGSGYGSNLTFSTTNGTVVGEAMRIDNYGNIGINTTAPRTKLEVDGTAYATMVGIGTAAPLADLQVGSGAASMTLSTALGRSDALIKGRLEVDGNIYANANVGIGTATPRSALDVNGTVTATAYNAYVNRGDPASVDFSIGSGLTANDTWTDIDLSSIVPSGIRVVHLLISANVASNGSYLYVRKNGQTNAVSQCAAMTAAGMYNKQDCIVETDTNRIIEAKVYTGVTSATITVKGWFK